MAEIEPGQVTLLLDRWRQGDRTALAQLMPLIHDELSAIARRYLSRERVDHTLQTSGLVNEAYLRLVDQRAANWKSRAHFLAVGAQMMRRILVDHARSKRSRKRGGEAVHLALEEAAELADPRRSDLVELDDAMKELERLDGQQARIVELRFFGGLTSAEIAQVLGLSTATVSRRWRLARAWLYRSLAGGEIP